MPAVSLIVPCYESAGFLSETIASVRAQEFADWELILVDDGSRDATWKIIADAMSGDARIRGFSRTNQGTTATRNFGASQAHPAARFLFFLDHDDQLAPEALARMHAYLETHPEVGLLACQYEDVSAEGRHLGTGKRSRWVPGRFFPRELRDDEIETPFVTFFCATGQGPFAMYRRSVFEKTDGWEPTFWPHEDTDMFCQMALLAPVHFLPDRWYWKRTHPAQGLNNWARTQEAYARFREKWERRPARNAQEAAILRAARRYYHTMHRPCRDLKTANQALREWMANPNVDRWQWFARLVAAAGRGFFVKRLARW